MIGLQAAILLLLGVCCSADDNGPDCASCVYHNNIGFLGGDECQTYFMCIKNPFGDGSYRYEKFCCAEGLSWDQEHLTCVRDSYCVDDRSFCPSLPTTTDLPCANSPGPDNRTFFSPGYELMECPYGTEWSQSDCTCVFGADAFNSEPCTKLLDFTFQNTFDSDSCYNFAKGEPYGEPTLADDSLCLNGVDQFLQVGFLNNWFAWNPQARTFTLCLCVLPAVEGQTAGILSLSCDFVVSDDGAVGSVLDIVLDAGELSFNFPDGPVNLGLTLSTAQWTQVCVSFDNGVYNAYVNGVNPLAAPIAQVAARSAQNTHSAATLGFKDDTFGAFNGYLDDFLFFNEAKDAQSIADNYVDRFPNFADSGSGFAG